MRNPLIRIDSKLKKELDKKKHPGETYDSVLLRLLPKKFVNSFWNKSKSKSNSEKEVYNL